MDDRRGNDGRTDSISGSTFIDIAMTSGLGTMQKSPPGLASERARRCSGSGLGHEWVVYIRAGQEGWLLLQCVDCGAEGTIDNPSEDEWSQADYADARPYRWAESQRVIPRGYAPPRVLRVHEGSRCECPASPSLPPYSGYERIQGMISVHSENLSDEEKALMIKLADWVRYSGVCSRRLPVLMRSCEQETGRRFGKSMYKMLRKIVMWDKIGIHCSPLVLAKIIRDYAEWSRLKTWQRYKREGLCTHCGRAQRGRTLKCDTCREIEVTGKRLARARGRRKARNVTPAGRTIG